MVAHRLDADGQCRGDVGVGVATGDQVDAAYHKSDLRRHGVEFVSATQKVPENFAVLYEAVLDTVARIQIDQMAIDVRRGLRAHLVGGFAPSGTAPTGYITRRRSLPRGKMPAPARTSGSQINQDQTNATTKN